MSKSKKHVHNKKIDKTAQNFLETIPNLYKELIAFLLILILSL